MRFTITNVPNTWHHEEACKALKAKGYQVRLRGRGKRGSDRKLHQDLPLKLADRFTVYVTKPWSTEPYSRWTYRGLHGMKLSITQVKEQA